VELRGEGFEVGVLAEFAFAVCEVALGLGLQKHF
jgi:hypothetical protein